ncbi:MAG: hypothetical protein AB7P03_00765 [Kofleriaceae bacterium]
MVVRVALLVLALVLAASGSRAEAEPRFTWDAPAGCPTADQLRARIELQVGGAIDGVLSAIRVSIQRTSRGFVAFIDLRALTVENEVRELRARRCDALVDGIAVIVARLVTQVRTVARVAPRERPIVEVAVAPIEAPGAPLPGAPQPPSSVRIDAPAPVLSTWTGGIRLLALSGIGAQPSVAFGGELAAFVGRNNLLVELAVSRWQPRVAVLRAGAEGGVHVGLQSVIARVAWTPRPLPIRIWAGAEWGSMAGTGVSPDAEQHGVGPWAAINGGFGVAWRFNPRIHLVGTLELAVPFARTRFTLMDGYRAYYSSPAAVRSALGLEVPL